MRTGTPPQVRAGAGGIAIGVIAVLIGFLGIPPAGNAQGPTDRLWHTTQFEDVSRSLGLGVMADVRVEFSAGSDDRPGFFDIFTDLAVEGVVAAQEGEGTNIAHEGITFELTGTSVAAAVCSVCGATSVIRVPLDDLEAASGGRDGLLDDLDAERYSMVLDIRVGPETTARLVGLLLPAMQVATPPVEVPVPQGLSTLGWCGGLTTSNDLFARHSELEAIFALNPSTGRFDAAFAGVPGQARTNLMIPYGTGVFVRATSNFNIGMPPTLTGRLSNVASLDGSAVGVRWIGSHALLANCGDKTTSSAILNDTDGAERIFTFADGGWSGDFASAPAAVRNELSILNTGPFFIFTDGATRMRQPCASGECNRFFDIDVECRARPE